MNSWMHHCISRRTVSTGFRPSESRAVLSALLLLCVGLLLPVASPLLGLPPATSNSKPEYIYTLPQSGVISDTNDYKVTVEFAWNIGSAEPATTAYPVVYWYRNGNFIASVTSSLKNKTTDATGTSYYDVWDPYANGGKGFLYPAGLPFGKPNGGTRQIVWKNELAVSLKDPGANKTAVYTAYIPVLDAATPPAQVVLSPAQVLGQARPSLTVVRSPSDVTAEPAGAVTLWGDAKSHSNGLLQNPFGVAVDNRGMVYVADSLNHVIRRVTPGGQGATIAGLDGAILDATGKRLMQTANYDPIIGQLSGDIRVGEKVPSILKLSSVENLKVGSRLYVTGGTITTSSGTQGTLPTFLTVASINATGGSIATTSSISGVSGSLTFDVRDTAGQRGIYLERPPTSGAATKQSPPTAKEDLITRQDASDSLSYRFQTDGDLVKPSEPLFDTPQGLVTADDGSIFVADTNNDAIRRIYFDKTGKTHVQTICVGTLLFNSVGTLSAGTWSGVEYKNSAGLTSKTASLTAPSGIAFEGSLLDVTKVPVLYVLDFNSIKKITLNAKAQIPGADAGSCVTSVAYIGSLSQKEGWQGNGEVPQLYAPNGLVVTSGRDGRRIIYVADTANHVIRKLSLKVAREEDATPSDWDSDIIAGSVGLKAAATDTDGSTGYYSPVLIPKCKVGETYIKPLSTEGILPADSVAIYDGTGTVSRTVSRIDSGSLFISGGTLVGSGTADVTVSVSRARSSLMNQSRLAYPSGLAMDLHKNLYFTEMGSHNMRRVVMDDINIGVSARVETVAGQSKRGPTDGSSGEGTGKNAGFFYPAALAYDTTGDQESFLVADSANHCIRRVSLVTNQVVATGVGSMTDPTKIKLGSISGIQPLMRVVGTNIKQGAYVVSVDSSSKTITLNLPIIRNVDSSQPLTLEQDVFTSATALGYPGYNGNRDFANECAEYTYQWMRRGVILSNVAETANETGVAGADKAFLSLSNLQPKSTAPYELKISNVFNITAQTNQAQVYVTTGRPSFVGNYDIATFGGAALSQVRSDQGDMNFSLRAYIAPADSVSYQWQVYAPAQGEWVSLTDSVRQPIDSKVIDLLGLDGPGGIALEGTSTSALKISGYQKLLPSNVQGLPEVSFRVQAFPLSAGSVAYSNLSLIGGSSVLDIGTSALLAGITTGTPLSGMGIPSGAVVKSVEGGTITLSGGTITLLGGSVATGTVTFGPPLQVTTDQAGQVQQIKTVKAWFAPVVAASGLITVNEVDTGTVKASLKARQYKIPVSPVDLELIPDDNVAAFPRVAGDGPSGFQLRYQWMKSDQLPGVSTAIPLEPTKTTAYPNNGTQPKLAIPRSSLETGYYFVRYWVGSGKPEDNDPATVIGRPVYGNYLNISTEVKVLPGSLQYKDGGADVKVLNVNAEAAPSFSLEAVLAGASGTPQFTWSYLKWGEKAKSIISGCLIQKGSNVVTVGTSAVFAPGQPITGTGIPSGTTVASIQGGTIRLSKAATATGTRSLTTDNWRTIAGGSLSGSTIYAGTAGTILGVGSLSLDAANASLTLSTIERLPAVLGLKGVPPYRDVSGLYRLKAAVAGATTATEKYWVVAMRQMPSVYGKDETIYSLNGRPISTLAVDSGDVTLKANVVFPLPDQIPMETIYGGTLISSDLPSGITSSSDTMSGATYTWYRDTTPVPAGKTPESGSFTISKFSDNDQGLYTLRVSNYCGTLTGVGPNNPDYLSSGWSLVPKGLPLAVGAASAKVTGGMALSGSLEGSSSLVYRVAEGQTVALEIPVQSSYPVKYSWNFFKVTSGDASKFYQPSSSIAGFWESKVKNQTDSKYFIRSATLGNSGQYVVSGSYTATRPDTGTQEDIPQSLAGNIVNLLVEPVPDPAVPKLTVAGGTQSTASSVTATLVAGTSATLSAVSLKSGTSFVSGGSTSFFTYQWKKDGVPLVGETAKQLNLQKLTKSQAGSYTVDVSGVAGTKTSAAFLLAVSSKTATEVLYPVNFVNLNGTKYTISPSVANGVPAGTAITLTGMSTSTQTLLGWRVWDAAGNAWELPARNAQFTMPKHAVTISPTVGRSSVGWYTGFLGLDKPWGDLEWDIYPLMANSPVSQPASVHKVRGYFQAMISAMGAVSGKVICEGNSYPFTSTMTLMPDGRYSAPLKIQATLKDRTPWLLTGSMSLNMGLRQTCTFTKGSTTLTVGTLAGLTESLSVSGYGIPDGTVITGINAPSKQNPPKFTVAVSKAPTLSSGSVNAKGVPVVFGADIAALDNVMHVVLNDVVLEVTPPVMKSGRTLYGVAACNAGVYNALAKFINPSTGAAPALSPATSFTAAVHRFGIKDSAGIFGRGGVLSTNISNLGYATITGYLPNGAKLSFGGYAGRACYVSNTQESDPLDVFRSANDSGEKDFTVTAARVMQETLHRHTASISIPIWSTGDSPGEPLFGALLISDRSVVGCLGVLNQAALATGTVEISTGVNFKAGSLPLSSVYTHNYVKGYLYDPTIDPNWPKPLPFTPTALVSLYSKAPTDDVNDTSYPLENLNLQTLSSEVPVIYGTITAMGTLGNVGRGFGFTPSRTVAAGTIISSFNIGIDAPTGLFSGSFVEKKTRYNSPAPGPAWAVNLQNPNQTSLTVGFYAVTIQGGESSVLGLSDGAVGFMIRGSTKGVTLKATLGNGFQDSFQSTGGQRTFQTEALNINVYEPN